MNPLALGHHIEHDSLCEHFALPISTSYDSNGARVRVGQVIEGGGVFAEKP